MPITSVVSFVEMLRQSQVLEPEQLRELARLQSSLPDPRSVARDLIQRGWLTPYQVNQLFQDKGGELILGQYVILERLGEGGMGLVFKGRHRRMGRTVAIKVIRKEHIAHADALRRFQREMQAMASMSHPNIVMAYDGDQAGETHFFAMEYVDGDEMGSLLKKHGPLPIPTACDYLRQAALGLQHAHEKGMVHRDIKPSNLLVTRPAAGNGSPWGPVVKLLDLGVARLHEPPGGVESISALTKEGRVVGTPDFMSPEQAANSAKADIRSDIYSLGCTFYCMLAAQVPFPGGTPMEKLLKHRVDEPPPVETHRPEVSPAITAVLRKMMAKKPRDRYQTPAQVVKALDTVTVSGAFTQALAPTTGPRHDRTLAIPQRIAAVPRRGWLLVAGLMLGAASFGFAVVGVAYWAFGPRKASTTKAGVVDTKDSALQKLAARAADPKEPIDALRRDLLRFRQEHAGQPSVLEAGKLLMRIRSPLDELQSANIPAPERAPAFIPGERQPSFPAEVVAVLGQRKQRHWGAVQTVAISPDGQLAASADEQGVIRLWQPTTMQEQALLTGHDGRIYWFGFTADSRTLVSAGSDGTIRFWKNFQPGGAEQAGWRIQMPNRNAPVALAPDGQNLAYGLPPRAGQSPAIQMINLGSINRPAGKPLPGATLPTPYKQFIRALAFSADGKLLATAGDDPPSVHVWETNPPRLQMALEDSKAAIRTLAFSLEGSQLATGSTDGTVRVYDLSKPKPIVPRVLHETNFPILALAFVPGGRKLMFSAQDRTFRLWNLAGAPAGKETAPFPGGPTLLVTGLAAAGNPANPVVISGSQDTTVRRWNVTPPTPVPTPSWFGENSGTTTSVAFLADDRSVAACNDGNRHVRLWEPLAAHKFPANLSAPAANLFLATTADGRALALSGERQTQLRRQGDSGAYTADDLPQLPRAVTCLAFSSGGKSVATGSPDGLVQVADVAGPKPWKWRTLAGHRSMVRALTFSPDGKFLASAGLDGTVRLWGLNNDKEVLAPISASNVATLAFAPDGKSLAAGGGRPGAGEIWVWNLGTNQASLRSVPWKRSHRQLVTAVAFTPDGERLASAGQDGQVLLHSLASGEARVRAQLAGPIHGLALASCGRYAATANANGTVYILRLIAAR